MPEVVPRYATPRDLSRETEGAQYARVAALMGQPYMPHQRMIADVAGELLPDGRPAYDLIVLSMQRRAGKTALFGSVGVTRLAMRRRHQIWHTAQTRQDARDAMMEEVWPLVDGSPLGPPYFHQRLSAGSEAITCLRTMSRWRAFSPIRDGLHGKSTDTTLIDEAWSYKADQASAVMAAVDPAQSTRPRRQLWIVSAAGDIDSEWWHDVILAEAYSGLSPRTALFDFGAGPGDDPDDPATWARTHPAVGHTIDLDFLASQHRKYMARNDPASFYRPYLNIRSSGAAALDAIDKGKWAGRLTEPVDPPSRGLVLAFEASPDGSSASILAAWPSGDGVHVRAIEERAGTAWLRDRVPELAARYGAIVGYDLYGPTVDIGRQIQADARVRDLRGLTTAEFAAACMGFARAVNDGTITHTGQGPLSAGVDAAQRRRLQERWVWARNAMSAPLIAATVARHICATAPVRRKPVAAT